MYPRRSLARSQVTPLTTDISYVYTREGGGRGKGRRRREATRSASDVYHGARSLNRLSDYLTISLRALRASKFKPG